MRRTYADLMQHVARIAFGHGVAVGRDQVRTVIYAAYSALPLQANWRRYQTTCRITCQAPRQYTVSVADDGKTVSILSGVWPDWAAKSTIHIDGIPCLVDTRSSDTQLVLAKGLTGAKTAASATIYDDWTTLPDDFVQPIRLLGVSPPAEIYPVQLDMWYQMGGLQALSGVPQYYLLDKDANLIRFFPPPSNTWQAEILYKRALQPLRYSGHDSVDSAGTVSVNGTAVTGTGTAFSEAMVGCVLRVSTGNDVPTGVEGINPYAEERIIQSVESTTRLTVSEAFVKTYTDVRYSITDVLDVDEYLYQVLLALAIRELSLMTGVDLHPNVEVALRNALAADAAEVSNFQYGLPYAVPSVTARVDVSWFQSEG